MSDTSKIPIALREQCWVFNFGRVYSNKCYIKWCYNKINVFNYKLGYNVPVSKGGRMCLENVKPICNRCYISLDNKYTIREFRKLRKNNKIKTNKCLIS